ncbi:LOW QUALITY PROTEIN: uncharacterized protein K02A2.6-like [Hyposmocoma kahamanoa]|uniref:LOW QUALITY PROTEIN: uncharacterized protein K02A2.6-like n=1 Tax=Hyposmocoma kahamanoa TaxID=1477025 RepID=UPI000E6D98E3|nr:LOW QUALITY PROTEIN: uncharacterized protein K02A2.6-like [Hyposmocoma kahamanoa]
MSATFGILSNFNHEQQDWITYKSRLLQWFIANEINDSSDKEGVKRRAILLSALSESSYQLASNLLLPDSVDAVSYKRILVALDSHFTPKRCGFAERHHFYMAVQRAGETPAQWAARLRGLAAHCSFKNLEDVLLDKFVIGMGPGPEREKLFATGIAELSLVKAVDLAESVRCARAAAANSSAGTTLEPVFKIENKRKPSNGNSIENVQCKVCGRKNHKSNECRFVNYKCNKCQVKGHLRKMCKRVNYVESREVSEGEDDGELFNIRSHAGAPMTQIVSINGINLKFEIDSGSTVTAISNKTYKLHFSAVSLLPCKKKLISYTGNIINSLGIARLPVTYSGETKILDVYVIDNGGPPLLGRDFISVFNLELTPVHFCNHVPSDDYELQSLLKQHAKVFSDQLGCFNKYKIKLSLKEGARPVFFKARPVAFALREKIEQELDRLCNIGVIEPVECSEFASPIVPVLKHDGSVRICADYSQSINKQLVLEKYPLPTVQELFTRLHGGVQFSKLDMSSAYNQLQIIDDENITCINTHKGLFKFKRLVFGLSSAPAIFQRAMESILGLEGVLCFLDDILISGRNRIEHLEKLKKVLQILLDAGLTLRKEKCEFFKNEITYLGYVIDRNGIRKSSDKVKAIVEAPRPKNLSQLQSFLGLINYYRSFVPNAANILAPLYDLLKKSTKWSWTTDHEEAFCKIKNILASDKVLTHFDINAKIILTVDASPNGLGAILSQVGSDGLERPISFASRTLTSPEKKYSQIQKEATAIIFGIKRFHQYLYARSQPFTLRTDHKPLVSIFGPHRGIPEVSANRLQRYALFLSSYNYVIEYVRSSDNCADYLSRATLPEPVETGEGSRGAGTNGDARIAASAGSARGRRCSAATALDTAVYVNFVTEGTLPVTLDRLRRETENDATLRKVMHLVREGWPPKLNDKTLKPYFLCRFHLSLENGILMRGHKVIIPKVLQNKVLAELHNSHLGIVKAKCEARSKFWFPGVDQAIENLIKNCPTCSVDLRISPPRSKLIPWPYPKEPFYRIHMDFLGPIENQMYLVIVDAHSKWVECINMKNNITTTAVINKLYEYMSRFGIPHTIVTDNGTSFTSENFSKFCALNGISHKTTPIYHPASNGQAETYVKIAKKGIKSALITGKNNEDRHNNLLKYLFDYRNSVHTTTCQSPAMLVYGRKLRSRLDMLKPTPSAPHTDVSHIVRKKQCFQANYHGGTTRKNFSCGQVIMYKNYTNKNKFKWTQGIIIKPVGNIMFVIRDLITKKEIVRHKNQIVSSSRSNAESDTSRHYDFDSIAPPSNSDSTAMSNNEEETVPNNDEQTDLSSTVLSPVQPEVPSGSSETQQAASMPSRNAGLSNILLRNIPRVDYKKFF